MESKHFVCAGNCKTVSEESGICESDFCNKSGEDLKICGCEDGGHSEMNEVPEESGDETVM